MPDAKYESIDVKLMTFKAPRVTHARLFNTKLPDGTEATVMHRCIEHCGISNFYAFGMDEKHWVPILTIWDGHNTNYYIFLLATGVVCTNDIHDGPWMPMSESDFDAIRKDEQFVRNFYETWTGNKKWVVSEYRVI